MADSTLLIDTTPVAGDAAITTSQDTLNLLVTSALAIGDDLARITTLKVYGTWKVQPVETFDVPEMPPRARANSGDSEGDTKLQVEGFMTPLEDWEVNTEKDWAKAAKTIKMLIEKLKGLHTLEWTTELPFSKKLWAAISPSLKHLTLDMTVLALAEGDLQRRHAFFQHAHLKPLCGFRNLESLCIVGMLDSYQPIIWETVFRNRGMHTLEMAMVEEPMCRAREGRIAWPRIEESLIQTTGDESLATEYRGLDGTGHLHHKEGHGEYLDIVAIRKARIAAGLVSRIDDNVLPLKRLRLAGFVVDALPFAQGFDNLERIDFLANCFDAGFALPEELRDRVEVTTVTKDRDADSISIKTYSREDVQLITERVGELMVRSKSYPNLPLGTTAALARITPAATPSPSEPDDDDGNGGEEDAVQIKKSATARPKRPVMFDMRSSSYA